MTESQAQQCPNCGQRADSMAKFCPNCGQALQVTQSQPGSGYSPQSAPGSMHPPQQSGPSAGKIVAWIVGILAILLIGIPVALVALVILLRVLGVF